jgi:hypothetical protein
MTELYAQRAEEFAGQEQHADKKSGTLVLFRLLTMVTAVVFAWIAIRSGDPKWWIAAALFVVGFLICVRLHSANRRKKELLRMLATLNRSERDYLESHALFAANGDEFRTEDHFYAHDLDIFGDGSLFQHLNRTGTIIGKRRLARSLSQAEDVPTILGRQECISEMQGDIEFRQQFHAKALLAADSGEAYRLLESWTDGTAVFPRPLEYLRFAIPALYPVFAALYLVTDHMVFIHLLTTTFVANILILATQLKKMNSALGDTEKISRTLANYGELVRMAEEAPFACSYFQAIRNDLRAEEIPASKQLSSLAGILRKLESIQNGFGAIVLNGTLLYHIHAYRDLLRWKKSHSQSLLRWLEAIGEIETLGSFANLKHNNPGFCMPQLSETGSISFSELGHPMIFPAKRVNNDLDFSEQPFVILTGSNMSGKSTFLRTLGVNMVLANAGSCVCAAKATFSPMPVLVSMRLSDSLGDSESYFFAEVRRLKEIMERLRAGRCFVLLDEILRGTNSDDKRSGTIGVIDKLRNSGATGAIATHDLEVCEMALIHPARLVNKCFEAEIRDGELFFDYRLRDGICRNKSATFLMQKMGII